MYSVVYAYVYLIDSISVGLIAKVVWYGDDVKIFYSIFIIMPIDMAGVLNDRNQTAIDDCYYCNIEEIGYFNFDNVDI